MRRRVVPYAVALLLAAVLSLVPAVIFPELAAPGGRGSGATALVQTEATVFKVLVTPPSWLRRAVVGEPTLYGGTFAETGPIYESSGLPPFAYAVSHLAWAVPLWFAVALIGVELLLLVRRRYRSVRF